MILLAAGGLMTFFLLTAHYFSAVSRRLSANADVTIVLLNKERPMLFVYHPASKTVNAAQAPARAARGASAYQRAGELLKARFGAGVPDESPAYIEVKAPDMETFEDVLNNWRARPALLGLPARWLYELKKSGATNLSIHDMALLALELSRLNSSNFIKEDFDGAAPLRGSLPGDPPAGLTDEASAGDPSAQPRPVAVVAAAGPQTGGARGSSAETVRLEVLNASGRKDLAATVAKALRKKGFDVINIGTYRGKGSRTKIVNCSGDIKAARGVRDALGLGRLEIYSRRDRLAIAQVRIILGPDFDWSKLEKNERRIR